MSCMWKDKQCTLNPNFHYLDARTKDFYQNPYHFHCCKWSCKTVALAVSVLAKSFQHAANMTQHSALRVVAYCDVSCVNNLHQLKFPINPMTTVCDPSGYRVHLEWCCWSHGCLNFSTDFRFASPSKESPTHEGDRFINQEQGNKIWEDCDGECMYSLTYKFVILGVLVVANAVIYQILSGEVSLSTVGTRKCLSIHLNTKISIKNTLSLHTVKHS